MILLSNGSKEFCGSYIIFVDLLSVDHVYFLICNLYPKVLPLISQLRMNFYCGTGGYQETNSEKCDRLHNWHHLQACWTRLQLWCYSYTRRSNWLHPRGTFHYDIDVIECLHIENQKLLSCWRFLCTISLIDEKIGFPIVGECLFPLYFP